MELYDEEPAVLKQLRPKKPKRRELQPEDWARIRETRKQVEQIAEKFGMGKEIDDTPPSWLDRLASPNPHYRAPPRRDLQGSQSADALLDSSLVPLIDKSDSLLKSTMCSQARLWKKGVQRPPKPPSPQKLGEQLLAESLHRIAGQAKRASRARVDAYPRRRKHRKPWDTTYAQTTHWPDALLLPPVRMEPTPPPPRASRPRIPGLLPSPVLLAKAEAGSPARTKEAEPDLLVQIDQLMDRLSEMP
jgi:hypothetical protein